jgi:hypothetical protein
LQRVWIATVVTRITYAISIGVFLIGELSN